MIKSEAKPTIVAVNELLAKSPDGLREIVRAPFCSRRDAVSACKRSGFPLRGRAHHR